MTKKKEHFHGDEDSKVATFLSIVSSNQMGMTSLKCAQHIWEKENHRFHPILLYYMVIYTLCCQQICEHTNWWKFVLTCYHHWHTYFSAAITRLDDVSALNSGSHFSRKKRSSFTIPRILFPFISAKHSSIALLQMVDKTPQMLGNIRILGQELRWPFLIILILIIFTATEDCNL